MTRYLLDTDTFSLYLRAQPVVVQSVLRHLSDHMAVTIITVEELWAGWAALVARARNPEQLAAAYARHADTLNELRNWPVTPFPLGAVQRYSWLKKQKYNVGANDLKIAAIAIEMNATVVTHNTRDFSRVSGVHIADWVGP